jgi:aryl-alcohol dehydrogenase-like predicted oxidoreductase
MLAVDVERGLSPLFASGCQWLYQIPGSCTTNFSNAYFPVAFFLVRSKIPEFFPGLPVARRVVRDYTDERPKVKKALISSFEGPKPRRRILKCAVSRGTALPGSAQNRRPANRKGRRIMLYNKLPGTSLKVSAISLGTMMFGGQTGEADSLAIMDYAYSQGVNFWDTANSYNQGESERIVGKGLKGRRDDIILATKVFNQMGEKLNDRGLSRRNIISAVEASLTRLQTDHIDLYYLHSPDHETRIEESLEAMSGLVRAGKIRYVGISNYAAWQIADILALCDKRGFVAPVVSQNVYNILTRGVEAELVPCLREHALGMAVFNPLAGGLLSGKHKPGKPAENTRFANNENYYKRYWSEENFNAVDKLSAVAAEHGMSLVRLAMQWCVGRPCVTSVISGVSRLAQIEQNIASLEGPALPEEAIAACDAVWRSLAGTRFAYNR